MSSTGDLSFSRRLSDFGLVSQGFVSAVAVRRSRSLLAHAQLQRGWLAQFDEYRFMVSTRRVHLLVGAVAEGLTTAAAT